MRLSKGEIIMNCKFQVGDILRQTGTEKGRYCFSNLILTEDEKGYKLFNVNTNRIQDIICTLESMHKYYEKVELNRSGLRKVQVYKMYINGRLKYCENIIGYFHTFTVTSCDNETYVVAVIELEDGTIIESSLNHIKFIS